MSIISFELAKGNIINLSTVYYYVTPNSMKYLPITMTFTRAQVATKISKSQCCLKLKNKVFLRFCFSVINTVNNPVTNLPSETRRTLVFSELNSNTPNSFEGSYSLCSSLSLGSRQYIRHWWQTETSPPQSKVRMSIKQSYQRSSVSCPGVLRAHNLQLRIWYSDTSHENHARFTQNVPQSKPRLAE